MLRAKAIKFFGQKLQPFWRRNGATPADLLHLAEKDYAKLRHARANLDERFKALASIAGASITD